MDIDEILYGIDMTSRDDENGWWETSTGVEFGAERLSLVRSAIAQRDQRIAELEAENKRLREALDGVKVAPCLLITQPWS